MLERELDVQRGQRTAARREPIEQAIERGLEQEHEALDIAARHRRAARARRVPRAARPARADPSARLPRAGTAGAPRGRTARGCRRPAAAPSDRPWSRRAARAQSRSFGSISSRASGTALAAARSSASLRSTVTPCARRARDRIRREPREPDHDRAGEARAPRSSCSIACSPRGSRSRRSAVEAIAIEPERAGRLRARLHPRRQPMQGSAQLGDRRLDLLGRDDARAQLRHTATARARSADPARTPAARARSHAHSTTPCGRSSSITTTGCARQRGLASATPAGAATPVDRDRRSATLSRCSATIKRLSIRQLIRRRSPRMRCMNDKVIVITGASSADRRGARRGRRQARGARHRARRPPPRTAHRARPPARSERPRCRHRCHAPRRQRGAVRPGARSSSARSTCGSSNAGRGISRPVSQLTDVDVDDMMTINVKSVLYGDPGRAAALPRAQARPHHRGVVRCSARFPFAPIRSAYSAAKAAVNSLMASLRVELRPEFPDVHVSTVMPGVVATDFGNNALHGGLDSRAFPNAQPVEEVANADRGADRDARAPSSTPAPRCASWCRATSLPRMSAPSRPAHRSRRCRVAEEPRAARWHGHRTDAASSRARLGGTGTEPSQRPASRTCLRPPAFGPRRPRRRCRAISRVGPRACACACHVNR